MVKEIIHDPILLKIKSKDAVSGDLQIAKDLAETLEAHKDGCVGMAANMIGIHKRIIAFYDNDKIVTMFNPEIISKALSHIAQKLRSHMIWFKLYAQRVSNCLIYLIPCQYLISCDLECFTDGMPVTHKSRKADGKVAVKGKRPKR